MSNQTSKRTLAFQANERNVFLHILTACNLSCRHCYINSAQHGSATLSAQTIADWLQLFYKDDVQTNVIFLGGEPTLHKDLPFAVKTARQLGYKSVTVDTNGFLHHEFIKKISPQEAVLSFSLDGPSPEINDLIRGEGVFSVCSKNLQRAVSAGFEVSVIYTVSSLNIDHLYLMPEILHNWGVSHFFIQVVGLRGKSAESGKEDGQCLQPTHSEWLTKIPPVAEKAAALGLHVIYPKVFLEQNEKFECAGTVSENYFVFPNGRVYLCPLCEDYPINNFQIENNVLIKNSGMREEQLFSLTISEGCVMNKLLQPGSIQYHQDGTPIHRISCCLLKQEI